MNTDRKSIAQLQEDLAHLQREVPVGSQWKHLRSGGVYTVLGHTILEHNQRAAVLYRNANGGPSFARRGDEFLDWRFVRVHKRDGQ